MAVSFVVTGDSDRSRKSPSSRTISGSRLKKGCSDLLPAELTVLNATLVELLIRLRASGPEFSLVNNLHCKKRGSADSMRCFYASSRESSPICNPSTHCVSSAKHSLACARQLTKESVKSNIKAASNARLSSTKSFLQSQVRDTDG